MKYSDLIPWIVFNLGVFIVNCVAWYYNRDERRGGFNAFSAGLGLTIVLVLLTKVFAWGLFSY